jgi:hypothetical protein
MPDWAFKIMAFMFNVERPVFLTITGQCKLTMPMI